MTQAAARVPMFSDGGPLFCDPATVRAVGSVFMGISADLVTTIEGNKRNELDACGLETRAKAARAWDEGFFDRSLVPVRRPDGVVVARDEHLRPATTLESLAALALAEAFAALCLRFRRDLDAGPERMNPNGGTIAMGHAFGATGAILLGCVVDELEQRGGRYGVAAVSGAAGLGVAVLVERVAS